MSLLAILNSIVTDFFYKQISSSIRGNFLRFIAQYINQIPIPAITSEQKAAIESVATRILDAKKANPAANVTALETEIDQLVYQLYGLTAEEIAIVEENVVL